DIVSSLSCHFRAGFSPEESAASFVPVNQVKQWEQINPHNVHEVPIQSADLNRRVILRRKAATPGHEDQHTEDPNPDNHVQSVHARHRKVKREENLSVPGIDFCFGMARHRFVEAEGRSGHMMFYKFLATFITLDSKKSEAKQQSQNQQKHDLRSQEDPHAQRSSVALLLRIGKVMQ